MNVTVAEEDGIEYYYDKDFRGRGRVGNTVFIVPCSICGKKLKRMSYTRDFDYKCAYCVAKIKRKKKAYEEYMSVETKTEKRFNEAVKRIKSQVKNFKSYEKAIEIARTKEHKYGSVPEAMVAIELIHLKYKIIPQQQIKRFRVDFAIPKEKLIIEVDGAVYHKNIYSNSRDAEIQYKLGMDWKIIHIPAEMIENDITKVKDIIDVFYRL